MTKFQLTSTASGLYVNIQSKKQNYHL